MSGHSQLPDYEPIAHNGNRVRNAIHRAEYWALASEGLISDGDDPDAVQMFAQLASAWAQIAVATAQTFGER